MQSVELNSNRTAASGETRVAGAAGGLNWSLHAVFAVVFAAFLLVYIRTLALLVYTWAHAGTYEYAFLIFPVCLVLIWLRRDWLRLVAGAPRWRGLIGVFALALLWLAGAVADVNLVQHFAVVALPSLLVYSIYGPAVTRILIFPLAYMFFAVPYGNFMVGPLQDITAHLSVFALQFTDVPVYMTGRIIQTPASTWHVAEACSGVKFFIATTAFGVLYANLFFQSTGRRLVFVACSLLVPIIANGLRVFFTILIGEKFGVQYATGTDHLIFGWQFFGGVMVLLFLAGWPWHEPEPAPRIEALRNPVPGHHVNSSMRTLGLALCAVAALAIAPTWLSLAHAITSNSSSTPPLTLPATLAGMPKADQPTARVEPGAVFKNADDHKTAFYAGQGGIVRVHYARYDGASKNEHELITGGNHVFDSEAWKITASQPVTQPEAAAGMMELMLSAREKRGQNQGRHGEQLLVWYAYTVNGRLMSSPLRVKALQAWTGLRAAPLHSAAIVLSTPFDDPLNKEQARIRLQRIAPAAIEALRVAHP